MKSTAAKIFRTLFPDRRASDQNEVYSHKTHSRQIYFSIAVPQTVGFTDQTMLFALLYKLGSLLKLDYYYTPIHDSMSRRQTGISDDIDWHENNTGEYLGIFDYVGFEACFRHKSRIDSVDGLHGTEIVFARDTVDSQTLATSKEMVGAVKSRIVAALPSNDEPLHVRFTIAKQGNVVRWLHELPNELLDFNYADIYWKYRSQNPVPEVYTNSGPRFLMHIRQGDTAVIETPWKSYIQIWGKGKDAYQERESIEDIRDDVVITVADFEQFYTQLKSQLAATAISTLVHSDGFSRAFFKLNKRLDRLKLSTEQTGQLLQSREGYNDRAFDVFSRHPEADLYVGEDLHLLYELIHAFYTCDVVIVGTQQKMLPKQYAYSFTHKGSNRASPLLITLYKNEPPDYAIYGNQHMLDHCINVDLNKPDIATVAGKVTAFLAARHAGPS